MKTKGKIINILSKNIIFYIILSIIYLEILIRFSVFQSLDITFLYPILFSSSFALLLGMLCQCFQLRINKMISSILLFLLALYFSAQIVYYDFFKVFLTFYSIGNGGQIAEFYNTIIQLIFSNSLWIILTFIPFCAYVFYFHKKIAIEKMTGRTLVKNFGISLGIFALSYLILFLPIQSTQSLLEIYKEKSMSERSVNKLGLLTSCRLDFESLVFGHSEDLDEELVNIEQEVIEETYDPQIMNIDFDTLISNEKDETIKKMHQYFQKQPITYKNEYTGMFKDYNLIMLTCESFSPYAIDKDLTPTLYKLAHEGFVFNNFYTPKWDVSTSDGEYVATQSLLPKNGTWSMRDSSHNTLPFVMGNQFRKLGYVTKAYHNHTYTYYGRDQSHPNMGYDYKGLGNGLNVKETWPESDVEMIEKTVGEYIHEDHFHVYYMTVSGHSNYTFDGNVMARKNLKYVKNLPYSDSAKAYLSTQIELDKAMEKLLKELEKAGKDQNTLIVMSSDHYPYPLDEKSYDELAGHELEKNFELYKNVLIIYSPSMKKPIVVDKLGSSLDIIPTISNLLGLEYDSRLCMGTDLLSDSDSLVIFENRSFITDKVMYNSETEEAKWINGAQENSEYLEILKKVVKQKFQYSRLVLEKNYYKYIKYDNSSSKTKSQ